MCNALRNLELKKARSGDGGPDLSYYNDVPSPRRGERQSAYWNRVPGGDGGLYVASALWDRHRARLPKRQRIRTPRAPNDDGYVGYTGNWANYLQHSTPGQGRARRKPMGAMPASGPGKS